MARTFSLRLIGVTAVLASIWLVSTAAQGPATTSPGLEPFALRMDADRLAARAEAIVGRRAAVPGEAIVKFRPGVGAQRQAQALRALRGGGRVVSAALGDLQVVRAPAETDPAQMAEILARQPEVEWAEPNYRLHLHATPNDPAYSRQWNLNLINMPSAWDINPGGSTAVTVAVIDTGVTTVNASYRFSLWNGSAFTGVTIPFGMNPDIRASRIMSGVDFAFWSGPVLDMEGHGTHVAGTILQETNNNIGLAGIAYGTRLMPLKACIGFWEVEIAQGANQIPGYADEDISGCFTADIAEALRYAADNGANVINLSLGGPGPSNVLKDALTYAVNHGAFVAISAGNGFEDGNPVEYPAADAAQIDGAISVGAVGRSKARAYYSSTGPHVEIAAPGGDFRADGLPGTIYQVGLFGPDHTPGPTLTPAFNRYYEQPNQGTSMAAPHVAGVAALLYSQGIHNPAAIEAALKRFAEDLGPPGRDDEYGYGLVDARSALRGLGVAR